MREYGFRIFHKESKIMIYLDDMWICGEYSSLCFDSTLPEYDGIGRLPDYPKDKIENYEIMLKTGFKDSNNINLYDEDIVKWEDGFYILRWSKIYNWYEFVGNITADTPHADENGVFEDNVKLVGNTYENPELIPELLRRPQND